MLEALRCIPIESQVMLELHYWEELTVAQIAAIIEIPVGTAKTRIRRARQLLREQIGAADDPSGSADPAAFNLDRWAKQLRTQLHGEA